VVSALGCEKGRNKEKKHPGQSNSSRPTSTPGGEGGGQKTNPKLVTSPAKKEKISQPIKSLRRRPKYPAYNSKLGDPFARDHNSAPKETKSKLNQLPGGKRKIPG